MVSHRSVCCRVSVQGWSPQAVGRRVQRSLLQARGSLLWLNTQWVMGFLFTGELALLFPLMATCHSYHGNGLCVHRGRKSAILSCSSIDTSSLVWYPHPLTTSKTPGGHGPWSQLSAAGMGRSDCYKCLREDSQYKHSCTLGVLEGYWASCTCICNELR